MARWKQLISLGLIAAMAISLVGCHKEKKVSYDPLTEEDDTIYKISVCQDSDSEYLNNIYRGFEDSLNDLFGESHLEITKKMASTAHTPDEICDAFSQSETQLIFANGEDSVSAASTATDSIPVVGAGVMDYQHLLHLNYGSGTKWNKQTGTNVTGVSSIPDLASQLSLIIETTPDLKSVGLLYSADDHNAIYQLDSIETYFDEAGIPWKEYLIPSDVASTDADAANGDVKEDEEKDEKKDANHASAVKKTKTVAPSVTEGSDNDVNTFGESAIFDGIISPSSAHTPLTSEFWTEALSTDNPNPLPENASMEETIQYASRECSCLFIPSGSYLTSQMEDLSSVATEAGIRIVGGDHNIGQYTLTSSYIDPYAIGYAAGKKVYRILINGDNPGSLKISSPDSECVKLYQADLAEKFEMEFPKSFHEINDFLETYEIGSSTERITNVE